MAEYILKSAVVTEIKRRRSKNSESKIHLVAAFEDNYLLSFLDTLEVKDPYEQYIQYSSIKDGIKAHAEIYSFNIESKLFNQLTKEQQELWREEIEQACISGGEAGVELARDIRYKENLEVKEVEECKQPEYGYFETTYQYGIKPRWNIGDTLAYYEFYTDREGEYVLGKVTKVDFDKEQCDWFYTFEDGKVSDEQSLLEEETYKKN